MRNSIRNTVFVIAVLSGIPISALAANWYVLPGASGSGSSWADALGALPETLVRGDTYYLADGSYGSYDFDDAEDGSVRITILKATEADHGDASGWDSVYGDGQATFNRLRFRTDYYTVDGNTRNESDWADTSSYGFRVTSQVRSHRDDFDDNSVANHITIRHLDIGAALGSGKNGANDSPGIWITSFKRDSGRAAGWRIQRCHIHNTKFALANNKGVVDILYEYNQFSEGYGKEAIRGGISFQDSTIRYNVFKDSCQQDVETCTAEVALWAAGGDTPETFKEFDNVEIYGNVFWKTTGERNNNGVIFLGSNDGGGHQPPTNNSRVYNNTIVGHAVGNATIFVNGGTGNVCRNNLWYNVDARSGACNANTSSDNIEVGSDPFVNATVGDFRLTGASATPSGTILPSPYDVDLFGVIRGFDGVWNLGAYQYNGAVVESRPSPPSNFFVVVQ